MVKYIQILFFCLCLNSFGIAQEEFISIEVSSPKVELGEPFSLQIKTNIEGSIEFDLPRTLEQIGGLTSGMSSRVTYSGGKGTVERYNYYDYKVRAKQEGTIEIGPAKIVTDQGDIFSNSIDLQVEKPLQMLSDDPVQNLDQAVFGLIELSKKEIYLGEPVIALAKVYSQINLLQLEDYTPFKLQGPAEVIPFDASNQIKNTYENINGQNILTLKLGKTIIFPDQAGTFEVSPFHLNLYYDHPRSLFPERMRITSNSEIIRVKPLPKNAPDDFIGAVGNLNITANFLNTKIKQGSVTPLVINIKGRANFMDIIPPTLTLPNGVQLLGEPEVEKNHHYTVKGIEGNTTFTYYLQFSENGIIHIDDLSFSYFHPKSGEYISTSIPRLVIEVDENQDYTPLTVDNPQNEDVMFLGENYLKPIHTEKKDTAGKFLIWTPLHKLLIWTPMSLGFIFTLFVIWGARRSEKQNNSLGDTPLSKQLLIDIRNFNKKNKSIPSKEAWNNLHKLLLQYTAFVFKKPIHETNNSDILNFFNAKGLVHSDITKIQLFLKQVENIQYGSANESEANLKDWVIFFEQVANKING